MSPADANLGWLSIDAVAQTLGASPAQVTELVQSGQLPAVMTAAGWLVDPAGLDRLPPAWLAAQQAEAQRAATMSAGGSPTSSNSFDALDGADWLADGVLNLTGLGDAIGALAENVAAGLSAPAELAAGLGETVAGLAGGLGETASGMAGSLGGLAGSAGQLAGGVGEALGAAAEALPAVAEGAGEALGAAGEVLGAAGEVIGGILGALLDASS